jgi:hypothetical protein
MLAAQTALGRVGEPDDVGRVIASLLSETWRLDQRPVDRGRRRLHHLIGPENHARPRLHHRQRPDAIDRLLRKGPGPARHPPRRRLRRRRTARKGIPTSRALAAMAGFSSGCGGGRAEARPPMSASWPTADPGRCRLRRGDRRRRRDNGPPAARLYYDPRYYAANVLDPDGYSLEFVFKNWQH